MKMEMYANILTAFFSIGFLAYGVAAGLERVPVFSLVPMKTEKEKHREYRFHAIGFGGMGLLGIFQVIYFFSKAEWAFRMESAIRIVLTLYLLLAMSLRVYIRGNVPGDSFDEK